LAPLARVLDVERPAGRAADGGEAFVARDLDVERLPDVFVDDGVGHGHPRYRVSRYRVSGCGEDPAFGIGHKRCKTATAYWDSGNVGTGPRVALRDADPWSPAPCGVAQRGVDPTMRVRQKKGEAAVAGRNGRHRSPRPSNPFGNIRPWTPGTSWS